MNRFHHFRLAVTTLLLLAASSAHAFGYCVANELQLQTALDAASDNGIHGNEDVDIHLVVGTYITGVADLNQAFTLNSTHDTAITIGGGYAAGCQQRKVAPALTVLDGVNATPVLTIVKTAGSISVDDMTLQRGLRADFGAGLAINSSCTGTCSNATASVTRTIIQANAATAGYCGGLFVQADHQVVYVADNLIVNNSASLNYGGACIGGQNGFNQFYGNTVFGNSAADANAVSGGVYCYGPSDCEIYDNIFWGNTGAGLWLQSTNSFLLYNDYGNRGGATPQSEIGALHVNPDFVNSANGNFHLLGTSPLIGASPILLDGTDLSGHPFPGGGVQDIGALQETIFENGVDIVL